MHVDKLKLTFLGDLSVQRGEVPLAGLNSRKAQALLCYLAVTGRSYSRPALAGLLWGETPDDKALTNLRKALTQLRRMAGSHLSIARHSVAFNNEIPHWIDVKILETSVTQVKAQKSPTKAEIEQLEETVDLYRGDFLEGFYLRNAPVFDEWALIKRVRCRDLVLQALYILAAHHMKGGFYTKGIDFTQRLLSIEPWREEAHRQLMLLLALSGRRGSALVQYERCHQILSDDLGIEPGAETIALYERIRDDDLTPWHDGEPVTTTASQVTAAPSKHAIPGHNLPAQKTLFIGRETEGTQLADLLVDPAIRLVTIAGPGGIGKTQLATAVTLQIAETGRFRDGVFFVPLTPVTTRSLLITAIAEKLELPLAGVRHPEKTLVDFLRNKVTLIVLDNFDHLLSEVDLLLRLLQEAPQSKLLVTSRERLKLLEEWVLDLDGLPYPGTILEAQTSDYAAINLFFQRARQIRSSFSLEKNLPAIVRICQLTQGIPLALEQAASLIRVSHAMEIADQIEESLDSLSTTFQNLPARHRSMRAVFDGSWSWLPEEERMVFCRLSVFQGSFSREAAEQVAGASLSNLAVLVDKSLLRRSPGLGKTTCYDLHELVRQYASERLLESGPVEAAQVHESHLDFYLSLVERAEKFWDSAQEQAWLERLEAERANLHTALRWASEHEKSEHLLRLNAALFTFWLYTSPAGEGVKWLESSLSMAWDERSTAAMQARAKALNVAGYATLPISDLKLAEARFDEGAKLYSRLGDRRGLAWSLRGCGFVSMILGDLAKAQTYVRESQGICQEIQDGWGLAWSNYDLGNIALAGGELPQAESLLEAALGHFRKLGIQFGTFRALISLGHLGRAQRKWVESKARYGEALAIQQETRYIQFVAQVLEGLAHLAVADNHKEIAVQLFGAAQARRDEIEMSRWAHQEIEYQRDLAWTRNRFPATEWQAAWDKGHVIPTQQGMTFALDALPSLLTSTSRTL